MSEGQSDNKSIEKRSLKSSSSMIETSSKDSYNSVVSYKRNKYRSSQSVKPSKSSKRTETEIDTSLKKPKLAFIASTYDKQLNSKRLSDKFNQM